MYFILEEFERLADQWLEESEQLRRRHGEMPAAQTAATLAQELRGRAYDLQQRVLEIKEASQLSGFTEGHLRRLIQQGVIPNAGERYAPRIRLLDLPVKPGALRQGYGSGDVVTAREQVVRSVANPN